MAQLALNKFQTETLEITTANQTAYTAPTGYTSIVLYAHVTNITTSAATFTMTHVRSSTSTEIVKNASVPPADAYIPLEGKLVLETSDSIRVYCDTANGIDATLSILKGVS